MECGSFCPGFEGIGKCWKSRQLMMLFMGGLGAEAPPLLFGCYLHVKKVHVTYHLSK